MVAHYQSELTSFQSLAWSLHNASLWNTLNLLLFLLRILLQQVSYMAHIAGGTLLLEVCFYVFLFVSKWSK